ncbi:MAG: hypothetical protein IKH52_02090, partial [Bacteroidaceae bacterium]|nr:hypothetical protein [Bacteroidaceae bacterium]
CGLDPQSLNHFRKHDSTKVRITIENISPICPIAPIISLYRPSRRCHGFCKDWALTLPPQCCSAMLPFKKLPLRSSCQLFARQ